MLQSRLNIIKEFAHHIDRKATRPKSILKLEKRRGYYPKPYLSTQRSILPTIQNHINKDTLKKSFPIISNMPWVNSNASAIVLNTSPFALTDRRFGILHHGHSSRSYF